MAIYRPHSVKIYTDAMGGEIILTDVTSFEDVVDPDFRAEVTAPNTSPTHVAMVARKPMSRGSTYDLVQFLANVGVSGLTVLGAVNPGFVTYLQKFEDTGAATGSGNRSLTYNKGILVPKSLKVDHQGDCKIDWELYALGDGTNAPVAISDAATLPTITQAAGRWTLGAITLAGVSFTGYRSLEIDFGNTVEVDGTSSYIDPIYASQKTHAPKITITGVPPTWFAAAAIPVGGAVVANATDKIFLRKRSQDGSHFVANGTAQHIRFVPAGLAGIGKAGGAEMQRVSESTIVITCAKDASGNNPIVCTTSVAIS